jgi:hypothetical protein
MVLENYLCSLNAGKQRPAFDIKFCYIDNYASSVPLSLQRNVFNIYITAERATAVLFFNLL